MTKSRITGTHVKGYVEKAGYVKMKTNMKTLVLLIAIFATLAMQSASLVQIAHADAGGNQVRVNNVSFSGSTVIVTVSATLHDATIQNVAFVVTISFSGTSQLNINKQGVLIFSGSTAAPAWNGYSEATFSVTGQGQGYYLVTVTGYDAATGNLLGSDWVDPQGTAG